MVVAHPKTFNKGVRARVAAVLTDNSQQVDRSGMPCPSYAKKVTEEQMSRFHLCLVSPHDVDVHDSIKEKCQNAMRFEGLPALCGGSMKARFGDMSSFQARMARECTPGGL